MFVFTHLFSSRNQKVTCTQMYSHMVFLPINMSFFFFFLKTLVDRMMLLSDKVFGISDKCIGFFSSRFYIKLNFDFMFFVVQNCKTISDCGLPSLDCNGVNLKKWGKTGVVQFYVKSCSQIRRQHISCYSQE